VSLTVVVFVLMFGAALTAALVARHRPEHWPVAAVLGSILAANLIRLVIRPYVLTQPGDPPLTGTARLLGHVEQGLSLLEPLAIAAGSVRVFLGRQSWPLLAVWAVLVCGLALTYPLTRGEVLRQVYLGVELGALVVAVGVAAMWARRWQPLETHHRAMAFIIAADFVIVVLGPWRYPLGVRWDLALTGELILFATLVLLQVGALCRKS
jgi:hypothetical protein